MPETETSVQFPPGTPEYDAYSKALIEALKRDDAWDFLDSIDLKAETNGLSSYWSD